MRVTVIIVLYYYYYYYFRYCHYCRTVQRPAGLVKGGGGREGENEEGKGGKQMQVGSEKELNCHDEPTSDN